MKIVADLIERFHKALRENGWALYIPKDVWGAYLDDLLVNEGGCKNISGIPERIRMELHDFLNGDPERASKLPIPTFVDEEEWDIVLAHSNLKGVRRESRPYYTLLRQNDGAILEVVKVAITFRVKDRRWDREGKAVQSWEEKSRQYADRIEELGKRWPRRKYRDWNSIRFQAHIVIQTNYLPKDRLKRLRRQIEDKLRKGLPEDIVRTAKSLKLLD